ncbi:YesL family protein [Gorillibacterium timonense]|uniref:YesL family protein n=1 Tax=Gorillibacterium timonense TaxID=1689269 RepID=UPI0009E77956|nr:DUF624 domain-containing protein [Gorillibacterium timonense]
METRGLMGGFYRISEWIMRLSAINLLWVFCSLPFFFLCLTLLITPSADMTPDYFRQWFLMVGIVSPFTVIPASAAMFAVARKWVTGDVDVPLWKTYWRNYKANYKQSMLGGFLFALLAVILSVNYSFYLNRSDFLQSFSLLFIVLMVFLAAAFLNFLSIMVHLHMSTFQIVKNSLLITIGQPINSIMLLVMNGAILFISVKYNFLIVFFMGSIMAIASFWNFNRGFTKIQMRFKSSEEDETEEESEDEGDEREYEDDERDYEDDEREYEDDEREYEDDERENEEQPALLTDGDPKAGTPSEEERK